ncbi:MAG TPA: hypothetical protein VEF76_04725 [Patescibacteria group bacterium]|nr:hypothetical protein [Patescibacteria group bacterium]
MTYAIVDSFEALIAAPFSGSVNALCWQRQPKGDFDEVAAQLRHLEEVTSLSDDDLRRLMPRLSSNGRAAVETMIADRAAMEELGLLPSIECVPSYMRDDDAIIPTDVYSFHVDRATVKADTYLCSYNEAASEGLRREDAVRRTDEPATRAALLQAFIAEREPDFETWLRERCYDLHYSPRPGATPYSFGIGNLWRIAVDYPGSQVAPCIHRAPDTHPNRPPRLLLIS